MQKLKINLSKKVQSKPKKKKMSLLVLKNYYQKLKR